MTKERVSDEWITRTLAIAEENCGKHGTVEVLGRVLVLVLNELQDRREVEKWKQQN